MGLFENVGSWFGFVGACVANADAICTPFLAFVALLAASGSALTLLFIAYKAAQSRHAASEPAHTEGARSVENRERVRRALAMNRAAARPAFTARLRTT